jgi:hypothetical protein
MPAHFLYLKNDGSPTRWDGTRYFDYLARIRNNLPADLQSLTDKARYEMPSTSALSIWRSSVSRIEVRDDAISIGALNDYGTRRFEFQYSGVRKFQTTSAKLSHMPIIVVQELVVLPSGVFRHTIADMAGAFTTIHAFSVSFRERVVQ